MHPVRLLLAAVAVLAAAPAVAQTVSSEQLELTQTLTVDRNIVGSDEADSEDVYVTGSRIVRQDFEAISPMTTVGPDYGEYGYEPSLGWREDNQKTANRALTTRARGASSVRVIRACELSLRLGDEDCAGN